MSIQHRQAQVQRFYQSAPTPCPYLPGQLERKLFTVLNRSSAREVNSALTAIGFRRSHDVVYRPVCPTCTACVPVRVPVEAFILSRGQRRILRRNAGLESIMAGPDATPEQFQLFARYLAARHDDGDMVRMTFADYIAMVEDGQADTGIVEFRDPDGTLVGGMLIDIVGDGVSAVYSFFDPDLEDRSLGSVMILAMIERAQMMGLPYLYLGYWIAGSRKMAYKGRFRPLEQLTRAGWRPVPEDDAEAAG